MSFTDNVKLVLRAIIGVAFAGFGLYVGYFALHEKPIDIHLIYVACALLIGGGAIIDLDPIYEVAKKLLSLAPSVKFGGNGTPAA